MAIFSTKSIIHNFTTSKQKKITFITFIITLFVNFLKKVNESFLTLININLSYKIYWMHLQLSKMESLKINIIVYSFNIERIKEHRQCPYFYILIVDTSWHKTKILVNGIMKVRIIDQCSDIYSEKSQWQDEHQEWGHVRQSVWLHRKRELLRE